MKRTGDDNRQPTTTMTIAPSLEPRLEQSYNTPATPRRPILTRRIMTNLPGSTKRDHSSNRPAIVGSIMAVMHQLTIIHHPQTLTNTVLEELERGAKRLAVDNIDSDSVNGLFAGMEYSNDETASCVEMRDDAAPETSRDLEFLAKPRGPASNC